MQDRGYQSRVKLRCLLPLVFLLTTLLPLPGQDADANAEVPKARPPEELEKIIKRITESEKAFEKRNQDFDKFIESLSINEMRAYLNHGRYNYTNRAGLRMVERWAFINEREILLWLQAEDRKIVKLMEKTKDGGFGSLAGGLQNRQGWVFEAFMKGWSRRDPHAAWEETKEPDGRVSYLQPMISGEGYGHLISGQLIGRLAAVDPEKAWSEFGNFSHTKYQWVYRESLLKGISQSLPDDSDWQMYLERAMALDDFEIDRLAPILVGRFLGRWMAFDSESALNWCRSEESEILLRNKKTVSLDSAIGRFLTGKRLRGEITYRDPVAFTPAIRVWLSKNFKAGLSWLEKRPNVAKELFLGAGEDSLFLIITDQEYRRILRRCFLRQERGELLRECTEKESLLSFGLRYLARGDDIETVREAIDELELSPELSKKIVLEISRYF